MLKPRGTFDVYDWERPLTEDGVERAKKVAKDLKAKKIMPDKIVSSYAFRALNTAVLFAITLKYPTAGIEINQHIYEKRAYADILDMCFANRITSLIRSCYSGMTHL